jgi:hypothetical protein
MTKRFYSSKRRQGAVAALLSSSSISAAARQCDVGERTLRRWLTEPAFIGMYHDAQQQLLKASINKLRSASVEMVETLRRVALDTDAPAGARAGAARSALELLFKGDQLETLASRVTELEQHLEQKKESEHGHH